MSALLAETAEDLILERAREAARAENKPYAGSITPIDAWALVRADRAVLVDVRSHEERKFVGYVVDSVHVPWASGISLTRNPRFLRELEAKVGKEDVVLLLCRSGKRSALAAEAATRIGFTQVYNVLEAFEGDLDDAGRRGTVGGWRFRGLKWAQD